MHNNYPLSNLCDFEVMINSPLSNYEQNILLNLYQPIVGDKVISLYQTLNSLVSDGNFESDIQQHEIIIKLMHLRSIERFSDIRNKLEAIGLLDTFYKDNLYIYHLKKPLDGIDFFNNIELSTLLEYQLGEVAYSEIYCKFVMRKLDLDKFENITHTFNEIYDIEASDNIMLSQVKFSGKNNGIIVKDTQFDYKLFTILVSAQDLIKEEYFIEQEFIDAIYRYSFLYGLNVEEMKNAVLMSCDENRNIDLLEIGKNAKSVYNQKGKKLGVVPKTIIKKTTKTNNKLIDFLESTSPNGYVQAKTGTSLTGSEIEMFDQLLRDTNINIGVLNVLIGYVLEESNGNIPGYNYFLKIVNTWKRAKIISTQDAIEYINNPLKNSKKQNNAKTQKNTPNWYDEYISEVEKADKQSNNSSSEKLGKNDELEELRKFFNPSRKDQ